MHRRRKWTASRKQAVLAQHQPGESWSTFAKRVHVNPSQIYEWRRQGTTDTLSIRKAAKGKGPKVVTGHIQSTIRVENILHFCPTCGMGLDTVAAAMTKAG